MQLNTVASSPPSQPPSNERSICWLKTSLTQQSDKHKGDYPVFTVYDGSDNCHLTFSSFSSPPNYGAKLTLQSKDANQMDIVEITM